MQRPGPGNGGPQGGRPGPGAQQPGRPGGPGNGFGPGPGRNDRPGPQARWNRGDRLPPDFRGPQYRIDNPRAYGLAPAPRGHYWVSSGSDFLLVAAATGIITSIILNGSR